MMRLLINTPCTEIILTDGGDTVQHYIRIFNRAMVRYIKTDMITYDLHGTIWHVPMTLNTLYFCARHRNV